MIFWKRLSLLPKNWKTKNLCYKYQFRECKTKNTWKGCLSRRNFHFYRCYEISFYNFCNKHPLIGKNTSKFKKSHLIFLMLQAAEYMICFTRVPLILLSFKVCKWVSQRGIGNTWPDLHFFKAKCLQMTQSPQLPAVSHVLSMRWHQSKDHSAMYLAS